MGIINVMCHVSYHITQEQRRDVGVGDGLAEVAGEALQVVAAPLHQFQDLPDCAHHLGPRLAQTLIKNKTKTII